METKSELEARRARAIKELNAAANMVKVAVGIGNNAAWAACLEASEKVKKHPNYMKQVKGGTSARAQFKQAFNMFHKYERALVWDESFRFFHVADMPPKTRSIYGDISDRDYYDFWAAFGFTAYEQTKDFYTSLVNKIRLACIHHNDANPEIMAWAIGAGACLDLASTIYKTAINNIIDECEAMPAHLVRRIFKKFDITPIAEQWCKAVNMLNPLANFNVEDTDLRNIMLGYEQLEQKWMDEETLFGVRIKTAQDYAEIFRTNGQMKKACKEFAEVRDRFKQYAR